MIQLPKELTSPLVSSIVKSAKKHRDSRILSLLIGLGIIIVFLTAISLAPQIGDKLGNLSVKKHNQYASADIGNPGIVSLINQYRASQNQSPPLPLLREDQNLANAACWMANDMAAKNYFSHTDSLGRNPFQRMADYGGYGNEWGAENLGVTDSLDPQVMFNNWQGSPGHNANMLGSRYDRVGLGLAYSPTSAYRWYWVTDFASSLDGSYPFQALTSNCVSNQQPPPTPTPTPSPTSAPKTPPCTIPSSLGVGTGGYGDVDGDGLVSQTDSDWVLQYVLSSRTFTPAQIEAADVNGLPNILSSAGDVGGADQQMILNFLGGSTFAFPACPDTDRDGFSDVVENYVGTDPSLKCMRTQTLGTPSTAWSPDLNGDNKVSLVDVLAFGSVMNSVKGDGKYNKRFDLNFDGKISLADILTFNSVFGKTCSL